MEDNGYLYHLAINYLIKNITCTQIFWSIHASVSLPTVGEGQ